MTLTFSHVCVYVYVTALRPHRANISHRRRLSEFVCLGQACCSCIDSTCIELTALVCIYFAHRNTYQRCRYIAQSFVHGDSLESTLVAIIVPEEEELVAWAKKTKVPFKNFADLCANPLVKPMILAEMNAVAKEAGLKGFEQVKSIHLSPVLFSVENEVSALTEFCCGLPFRGVCRIAVCVACDSLPFSPRFFLCIRFSHQR